MSHGRSRGAKRGTPSGSEMLRLARLTLLRAAPSAALWVIASLALLLAVRRWVPAEHLQACQLGIGDFLQALASIESVLLAFVVFMVWQQFDESRKQAEVEASELADLARVVRGLPEPACSRARQLTYQYAHHVVHDEWQGMTDGSADKVRVGWRKLDEIWDYLKHCRTHSDCEAHLHEEALARFNDLSDARTSRLTCATRRMPGNLRALLNFGALMLTASTTLLPVQSLPLHAFMTAALAAGLSHILWLIGDLDDAFSGEWRVSSEPFERVLAHLDDDRDDQ